MTPADRDPEFVHLELISRWNLRAYKLSSRERAICEFIIDRTFARDREIAVIRPLQAFCDVTGLYPGDVSDTLGLLCVSDKPVVIDKGQVWPKNIVMRRGPRDARTYQFLPYAKFWRETKPLYDVERALSRIAELDRLDQQITLGPPVEEPDLQDGLAAASRESALADSNSETLISGVAGPNEISETLSPGGPISGLLISAGSAPPSRAHVRAGDVSANVSTQYVSPSGEGKKRFANDEKNYAFDLVETLSTRTPRDRTDWERNRPNWLRRLRDHDPRIVIRAAGNVKEQEQTPGNRREKPMGAVLFRECQKIARAVGKTFHLW